LLFSHRKYRKKIITVQVFSQKNELRPKTEIFKNLSKQAIRQPFRQILEDFQ